MYIETNALVITNLEDKLNSLVKEKEDLIQNINQLKSESESQSKDRQDIENKLKSANIIIDEKSKLCVELEEKISSLNNSILFITIYTVKAFVVTPPKMTKNSIIFRGVTTKAIKFSIADENLFVCILIYLFVS